MPQPTNSNALTVSKLVKVLIERYGSDSNLEVVDSMGNPIDRMKLIPTGESLLALEDKKQWEQNENGEWTAEVKGILQLTSNLTIETLKTMDLDPEEEIEN